METVTAQDAYELPITENDKVYESLAELVTDVEMTEPYNVSPPGCVDYMEAIQKLFKSQKGHWYLRSNKKPNTYLKINPTEIDEEFKVLDLSFNVYARILARNKP